jgi:hypothetical protein
MTYYDPKHEKYCHSRSCWKPAERVVIKGEPEHTTVLCDFHKKAYLGVSS